MIYRLSFYVLINSIKALCILQGFGGRTYKVLDDDPHLYFVTSLSEEKALGFLRNPLVDWESNFSHYFTS